MKFAFILGNQAVQCTNREQRTVDAWDATGPIPQPIQYGPHYARQVDPVHARSTCLACMHGRRRCYTSGGLGLGKPVKAIVNVKGPEG